MINKALYSSASDEWSTPQDLFDRLNERFNFDLDPCANEVNWKCPLHFSILENGLIQSWEDYRVFCNPPYSDIKSWVAKAASEKAFTVMLIPARTDTRWFHEHIYKQRDVEIEFIKGRLKFGDSKNSAPFPSMIVIFDK